MQNRILSITNANNLYQNKYYPDCNISHAPDNQKMLHVRIADMKNVKKKAAPDDT